MDNENLDKAISELLESAEIVKKKVKDYYLGLSKEERIERMRELDDSTILWICEGLALEMEAYEICADAQIIKIERGLK